MKQHLPGGFVTTVVRAGDTVRRWPSPNAAFVHDLLRFLEDRGWDGAPRFLGIDEQGREVLSYLEGHVPWAPGAGQTAEVASDDSLAEVARQVRRLHDLAHVCWQFLALGPAVTDLPEAARRLRLLCDGYSLEDRTRLVETILWWQDRCWRGVEFRAAHAWVAAHRAELEAVLT